MRAAPPTTDPLARLTANEKACLRRCLLPQTAKEMAIDLGISSHAVEKRLKMARAKLGVSTSLAGARLLATAEGYQPPVPQPSDLSIPAEPLESELAAAPSKRRIRTIAIIGAVMILAICLALSTQDVHIPAETAVEGDAPDLATRKVGMNEAAAFIRPGFVQKDEDGSGYLDPREASAMEPRDENRDPTLPPAPPVGTPDPAAERKWMNLLDRERDGRITQDEYVAYLLPWILWQGVPADWHPAP